MNDQQYNLANPSFPSAVFPNFPEWHYDRKRKLGLNGYGSWEAIDIEVVGDSEIVYTKKSRPSSLLPKANSATVLTPCQDQAVLCERKSQKRDTHLLRDIVMTKQLAPKVYDQKFRCAVFPMEEKFLCSAEASSEVLTNEFQDFLKTNSDDRSLRKWMNRNLERGFNEERLLKHFDPTCFGIGRKLFSDLLQEDCKNSVKEHFNEMGAVGGGCLSYRLVRQNINGNLGVIICADGDGMDELCVKAVFTNCDRNAARTSHSDEFHNLDVEICGEIAQTLNGKIHNVDSVSGNNGDILISAMSDHHVLFDTLHGNGITFDWEERDAKFSEKSLSSSLLKTNFSSPFSSVVLNPYIHGECVVATKSGLTGLWQADRHSVGDIFNSVLNLNVNYKREKVCFKQIYFGAHPRQFFGCDQNSLYLFDVRSRNSPSCLFDTRKSPYLLKSEHIHTSQSCKPIGNEYEIVVATDNNIFIFDQRYSLEPLLKWDTVSDFPACYLKCVGSPCKEYPVNGTGTNCQFSNSLLLTGGMTTDKVYYYQMSRIQKCFNDKQSSYAPFSVAPPRILGRSPTGPKDYSTKLKYSIPSQNNLKHIISGFDGLAFEGRESSGVCVFQLTSDGEIFYQTLDANRRNGYEFGTDRSQPWENLSSEATNGDLANTSNNGAPFQSRPQNSFSTIQWFLSEPEGRDCVICNPIGSFGFHNDDATESASVESCKHRSLMNGRQLEYNITDNYFHCLGKTPELNLIDLDVPSDASELGEMLLTSWDDTNVLVMCDICSVSQLVPPGEEEITVCERNGKLISITDPLLIDAYMDGEVVKFPSVQINPESLRRTAVIPGESAKAAFLEHKEPVSQRLLSAWQENGVSGVLSEICDNDSDNIVHPLLKKFCRYTLFSLRWISGMHFTLFPHLKLPHAELMSRFGLNRNWEESPIRFLSWHRQANKFALALRDDTIKIYYCNKDSVSILKHKLQKNITCLEWRPLLATQLAVGTETAILIWYIDPKSHSTRPSSSAVQVLTYKGHSPVTSIAWSPTGDDLLLATSSFSSALVVWNTSLEQYQVIQHLSTSGGISRVVWSPDGSKVMVSTPSSSFRVFETAMWTNERWSNLSGHVQCACWNPSGSILLFALHGDPRVYSVTFPDLQSEGPSLAGCTHASVVLDLTIRDEESNGEEKPKRKENCIHSMVWDDTGNRVAIMFDEADSRSRLIALFSASVDSLLTIAPVGYIQGPRDAEPVLISFKPNFDVGSCLTICWSDASISYFPIYMPNLDGSESNFNKKKIPQPNLNLWSSTAVGSPYSDSTAS